MRTVFFLDGQKPGFPAILVSLKSFRQTYGLDSGQETHFLGHFSMQLASQTIKGTKIQKRNIGFMVLAIYLILD